MMIDKFTFLYERQKDKKEFSFEYINKQGIHKTHYPKGIEKIDVNKGIVVLLYSNCKYTFTISKMNNLKLINNSSHIKESLKNLPTEDYFVKLVKYLIKKNEKEFNNADAINNSLNKIYEMLHNQKQIDKTLLKKYMRQIKAQKINDKNQFIILPFLSNNSQKNAIYNALCYDVSVIQGPPGTGKTQTILNIIGNYIFQNKTVCVVSKNNSAIDNVMEKFEQCSQLYDFAIRMGNNDEYIPKLMKNYKQKIVNNLSQKQTNNHKLNENDIKKLYDEIQNLEKKYEVLVQKRNLLYELIAQKRHIDHKIKLYANDKTDIQVNPFFLSPKLLKAEIEYLKYRKDKNGEVNMNILFKAYTRIRFLSSKIDTYVYTMYQWRLEKIYAEKIIANLQDEIKEIKSLESMIHNKYEEYNKLSIQMMNQKINEYFLKRKNIAKKLLNKDENVKFYQIKKDLIDFYPVVITTLDSICSNIGYCKFDSVIVDETSQADIITCLPALNISKQIVFVGDTKQLSHIVDATTENYDLDLQKKYKINDSYCYSKVNALDSIVGIFDPPIQLLKEHYRCDYNIINFCNKMYYNNELIIYSKKSTSKSMKIMSLDQEKNSDVDYRKNGRQSFFNKIEEKAIIKYIDNNFNNLSIITPYGKQEENLKSSLSQLNDNIGTVYKFQGRENKRVFLTTVLTHEEKHCKKVDALSDETLNVAVSRAEEEFILFTHKKFFVDINHNLKYLISYIETYGEKIESNINSIFAYLYRQLPYVKLEKCYDSLWEKKVHQVLLDSLNEYKGFYVVMKTSLADVIMDQNYLNKNPDFKSFALNRNTHIDFLIVTELTEQPILAIEVDGKNHKEKIQIERDNKKDKILKDHNIPVWRIKSTDAIEQNDVELKLKTQINEFKRNLYQFLNENKWKK